MPGAEKFNCAPLVLSILAASLLNLATVSHVLRTTRRFVLFLTQNQSNQCQLPLSANHKTRCFSTLLSKRDTSEKPVLGVKTCARKSLRNENWRVCAKQAILSTPRSAVHKAMIANKTTFSTPKYAVHKGMIEIQAFVFWARYSHQRE